MRQFNKQMLYKGLPKTSSLKNKAQMPLLQISIWENSLKIDKKKKKANPKANQEYSETLKQWKKL